MIFANCQYGLSYSYKTHTLFKILLIMFFDIENKKTIVIQKSLTVNHPLKLKTMSIQTKFSQTSHVH